MNEFEEIKLMENEALLDKAIKECHKMMVEMYSMRSEIDRKIQVCQVRIGELLAHKALFGLGRGR